MTDEETAEILRLLRQPLKQRTIEFRLYYDANGKVITYSSEELPGNYIVVTREQYAEARSDVLVVDGKIVCTHKTTHIGKLTKNNTGLTRVSKYDINILVEEAENDTAHWKYEQHEIY